MKKFLLLILSAIISFSAYAQTGGMKGQVVSREDREPIAGVEITIDQLSKTIKTNSRYRFMFRRFANAFGTQNYGTESSSCFTSGVMAWQTIAHRKNHTPKYRRSVYRE